MTEETINSICKDLFVGIRENDLLQIEGKQIFYHGNLLTDAEKKSIIGQAETIKTLELWGLLTNEMKTLISKKMYYDSNTKEDILFAKAALWAIDVLENKINNLSKMK